MNKKSGVELPTSGNLKLLNSLLKKEMVNVENALEKAFSNIVSSFTKKTGTKLDGVAMNMLKYSMLKYSIQDNCQDISDHCSRSLDKTIKKARNRRAK